jgi:hypothetical protein
MSEGYYEEPPINNELTEVIVVMLEEPVLAEQVLAEQVLAEQVLAEQEVPQEVSE